MKCSLCRHVLPYVINAGVLGGVALALTLFFGELPNALRWPARILIWVCVLVAIWRFPADTRLAVEWAAAVWRKIFAAFGAIAEAPLWRRLEFLVAAIFVALATWHFALVAYDMSWCSLRTDEITSITRYSGRGPLVTATQYHRANNHIFFNLLNSVTPGAGSFHPLRARFWSFVSVGALLAVSLAYFWSRHLFAAGALMYGVTALNAYHLALALEARAYGFVALFAVLCAIAYVRYRRQGDRVSLAALGVFTVLGTYSVPYFIIFGGLLLLLAFLERPRRDAFLAGTWTLGLILFLYLPVLKELGEVAGDYEEDYGSPFVDIHSAFSVLYYLVPGGIPAANIAGVVVTVTVFYLVCLLPPVTKSRTARSGLIVCAVSLGFVAFCYVLGTPPRRVTAFVAPAFAFGLIVAVAAAGTQRPFRGFSVLCAIVVCAAALPFAKGRIENYSFLPRQKWLEFGRAMHLLFPAGTRVWFDTDKNNNAAYLNGKYPLFEEGDPIPVAEIAAGRAVVHDANYNLRTRKLWVTEQMLPAGVQALDFELARWGTRLWFVPSAAPYELAPVAATDAHQEFRVTRERIGDAHGIILKREGGWPNPSVRIIGGTGERQLRINRDYAVEGTALIIRLVQEWKSVEIKARAGSEDRPVLVLPCGRRGTQDGGHPPSSD